MWIVRNIANDRRAASQHLQPSWRLDYCESISEDLDIKCRHTGQEFLDRNDGDRGIVRLMFSEERKKDAVDS